MSVEASLLSTLSSWTQIYDASQVKISSMNRLNHVLDPPQVVIAEDDRGGVDRICHFERSCSAADLRSSCPELLSLKEVALAKIRYPGILIRNLHGLVRHHSKPKFVGLLYEWIDIKDVMTPKLIANTKPSLRAEWADDLSISLMLLQAINVHPGNVVLIDRDDNAWVAGVGQNRLPPWADALKDGASQGDMPRISDLIEMFLQVGTSFGSLGLN